MEMTDSEIPNSCCCRCSCWTQKAFSTRLRFAVFAFCFLVHTGVHSVRSPPSFFADHNFSHEVLTVLFVDAVFFFIPDRRWKNFLIALDSHTRLEQRLSHEASCRCRENMKFEAVANAGLTFKVRGMPTCVCEKVKSSNSPINLHLVAATIIDGLYVETLVLAFRDLCGCLSRC